MKIEVIKTSGKVLDWLVAKCEDARTGINGFWTTAVLEQKESPFRYSTDWSLGGPIIEREFITVGPYHGGNGEPTGGFQGYIGWDENSLDSLFQCDGPTPLMAAMRCYVVSELGGEVEVPDELW